MDIIRDRQAIIITELEDLSVYAFDKCIRGDLSHLIKEGVLPKDDQGKSLKKAWEKLYNEYCKVSDNTSAISYYLLACEINYIKTKLKIVPVLVSQASGIKNKEILNDYLKELSAWGYPVDEKKDFEEELKEIIRILNNVRTRYKRKLLEFEEVKEKKGEDVSIYTQKVKLERVLNLSIDIRKVNVLEWLAYWKEAENELKKQQKGGKSS